MAAVQPATQKPLTSQRIMGMMWSFAAPLAMEAAVRLNIFNTLDQRPKLLEEIARDTGVSPRGLKAILNLLVGLELLAKEKEAYRLTPESATFLVSTRPDFQGAILKHMSTQLMPKWLTLTEIVRTGHPASAVNQEGRGSEFFSEFVEAIYPMSAGGAAALADHLFAHVTAPASVLDLAAGSGVWGIAMAKKSPHITVTAVDWSGVIPITRKVAERHHVAERFTFVSGDLQTADFGTGHRLATVGHILHSEGEARSRSLAKRIFASLAPGGTIAIAEFIPDEDRKGPVAPLIFAMNMLVNTDVGDTFTLSEISTFLREAGFTNIRQLAAPGPSPLVLADKPA